MDVTCGSSTSGGVYFSVEDWDVHSTIKTAVFWLVILISSALLWQSVKSSGPQQQIQEISYSEFLSQVHAGNVVKVTISRSQVNGVYRDNHAFRVIVPSDQGQMIEDLRQNKVEIWFKNTSDGGSPVQLFGTWGPLILLAGLWFYMIRQVQGKRNQSAAVS